MNKSIENLELTDSEINSFEDSSSSS